MAPHIGQVPIFVQILIDLLHNVLGWAVVVLGDEMGSRSVR
jgi:hypothetical protein